MADWFQVDALDELPPQPRYLIVAGERGKRRDARYFHDLSKVKAAITNTFAWQDRPVGCDVRVYEWDGTGWQEIYFLAKGTSRLEHPLWKNGAAPKTPQVISEVDINEAVASILGTQQSEED